MWFCFRVLPERPGPHDESEAKLLRLLRTFNAAAAEIVSMMPGARRLVPHQYKFRLETV